MRNDLTDITAVIDRSGSMSTCRSDAEGGINHFIEEQKKSTAGECLFSLVQFDTDYEFVHKGEKIQKVGKYELHPRGGTALLDALGRSINEAGERLRKMEEKDRPALVIFVIVTDGQENSSHEFTKIQIKEMIEGQQKDYKWQFIFLGADASAFDEASSIGIGAANTARNSRDKYGAAYRNVSGKVSMMRCANLTGDTAAVASAATFSKEDREELQ